MVTLPEPESVYHVFGLNIASEIPFLDMSQMTGNPDVVIRYGRVPDNLPNAKINGVRYQAGPGEFLLRVDNIARYYVSKGRSVVVQPFPGAADEEILLFLMGSAMGALLHQRNILPLHASAIQKDGNGVLFMGPSSIGKSTLAAGFQKRGHALLADDVCALSADGNGAAKIIPGFPRLKLWADTLKKLETEKAGLGRVRLDRHFEKYFVPFGKSTTKHIPVQSIFVLNTTNTGVFDVLELKGMDKMDPLLNNTYRPRFLEGLGDKQANFRQCSAVAAGAAVFRVTRPMKGYRLHELMDLVERQW